MQQFSVADQALANSLAIQCKNCLVATLDSYQSNIGAKNHLQMI